MRLGLQGEDLIQSDLIQWARKQELNSKELQLLLHVPNGGGRSKQQGMKLKALGVRPGVPDLCLPVMRGGYGGLWLEVKDGHKGKQSPVQVEWEKRLKEEGYCVGVIRTAAEGIKAITWYLNQPK